MSVSCPPVTLNGEKVIKNKLTRRILLVLALMVYFPEISCWNEEVRTWAMAIVLKEKAANDIVGSFKQFSAGGVLVSTEWVLSSMHHFKRLYTKSAEIQAEHFTVFSAITVGVPYFKPRFFLITEIKLHPDFHWEAIHCSHDPFLVRLGEPIPFGVGILQPFHRRPEHLGETKITAFWAQGKSVVYSWTYKVELVPDHSICDSNQFEKDYYYCARPLNRKCHGWFPAGALLITNNVVLGVHMEGGDCDTKRPGLGYKFVSVAADLNKSHFVKLMKNTYFDTLRLPFAPQLKSTTKSTPKHVIKTRTRTTTPIPSGSQRTTQFRKINRPTPPLPMHLSEWEEEDCDKLMDSGNYLHASLTVCVAVFGIVRIILAF